MKSLLISLFLISMSLPAFARDCSLSIGRVNSNAEYPKSVIVKEVQKQMKKKGYKLSRHKEEARFHLTGHFLGARYHNGNPTILHAARYTAVLFDRQRAAEEITSSVSSAGFKRSELIVLRKALKKLKSCR